MPGKAHAMRFRFESHMFRVCRNNREEPKKHGFSLFLKRHTHSACVLRPMGKGRRGKWPLRAGRGTLRRRRAPAENPLSLTEVIPPRAAGINDRPRKAPPPGHPPQNLPLKRTPRIVLKIVLKIALKNVLKITRPYARERPRAKRGFTRGGICCMIKKKIY